MDATTEHHAEKHARVEDNVLVRGNGRYAADVPLPNQAYAYFVRSPHAAARIISIDTSAAEKAPGVVGVLTAKDMTGVGNLRRHPPVPGRGGKTLILPHRPAFAGERVVHIGEPVAMVVAESYAAAQDASEFVTVEYEETTPVIDAREALRDGAPQVWPQAPGNIAVDWPGPNPDADGNAKKVAEIFASAKHVARVSVMSQRMVGNCMEPRGATASYDPASDSYLMRACSQGAGAMREGIMAIMNLPKERIRVLTDDVGGAFGIKTGPYPENIALMVGARKLGRPIHWMSTRSEVFLTDNQARDIYSEVELALDEKGKFLALRIKNVGNLGAYVGPVGANIPTANFTRCLPGMYDIRAIDVSAVCAFTNTIPTAPYRGAGRPEASYAIERVVDEAARITGIDPVKLRRRNLIKKSAMPYKTPVGTTYDSGDFEPILDKALELADYDGFKQRRRESQRRGKYRGFGVCCLLEHSGGAPLESAKLSFPGDGTLLLTLNVQNTGQGHATVFPRVIAETLGIPADKIPHTNGDSANELPGYASVGSRSAMTVGHSIVKAMDTILQKGKPIAAAMLETGEADIVYKDGRFRSRRHRSPRDLVRGRISRCRAEEARRDRRRPRHQVDDRDAAVLSERRAHRRGRDRSRYRPHDHHRLHRGRRLRPRARSDDRRRPDPRLDRRRPRPGADGEHRLRPRQRPARHRLVHGLRHAARRGHAAAARCDPQRAGDDQSARRQRRRRSRHHGGDLGGDERRRRRHSGWWRRSSRHAGLVAAAVGSLPARQGMKPAALVPA